jgi:hypothetical protein
VRRSGNPAGFIFCLPAKPLKGILIGNYRIFRAKLPDLGLKALDISVGGQADSFE